MPETGRPQGRFFFNFWVKTAGGLSLLLLLATFTLVFINPGLLRWADNGPRDSLTAGEVDLLQDGDIIFRRGVGLPSDLIISTLAEGTGVSHSGFIFFQNGTPWVVHTVSSSLSGTDGVQTQPLEEFNRNSRPNSIVIVRPVPPPGEVCPQEKLKTAAYRYLELCIPFDGAYDLSTTERMYCTEFVWQVLLDAGYRRSGDRPPLRGPILGFSGFLTSPDYRVILDHRQ